MATGTGTPPSSSGISDAQMETLMATMCLGMKDELKRELSTEREAADEKLVKKISLRRFHRSGKRDTRSNSVTTRRCGLSFQRPAPPWMNGLRQ